jgi:hypothetical protein
MFTIDLMKSSDPGGKEIEITDVEALADLWS